ncbi:hypothetical protein EXIGLDRAFT_762803 [Exidia glandulosa HHB12029]|uniref:Alpha/beta hydrolase fold-3 domain-containing protein n=1 Tax=Exidia glandulosa HHB12029 TaxID=1314781 RepID=A0A165MHI5_EXIGL|nr:hypothetical protein EXIGLDRAFT_762803 [Exidia glandulosa HHB12029]
MPDGTDASDPRINPMCCDSARFPPVTMVVGTKDPLYPDCVAFCNKLKRAGQEVDIMVIPRAQHAWERFCQKGTVFWNLREEAFRRTEQRLRSAQETPK